MFYVGGDNLNATYSFADTTPSIKIFTNSVSADKIVSPFQYNDLVINFKNKIKGDLNNPNTSKISWQSTNVAYSTILNPVDFITELNDEDYKKIDNVDSDVHSIKAPNRTGIPQQIFIFDVITSFENEYGQIENTTDIESKILWFKNNVDTITVNFNGFGSYNGGKAVYLDVFSYDLNDWYELHNSTKNQLMNASSVPTNITLSCNKDSNQSIVPWNLIDDTGMIKVIAYTEATTSTSKPSVLNTNYIELKITFKNQDKLTTSWSQIIDDSLLNKLKTRNQNDITNIDYINKTAKCGDINLVLQSKTQPACRDDYKTGSPNKAYYLSNSTLQIPSTFITEVPDYSQIDTLGDGKKYSTTTIINGEKPQQLFVYNIISMLQQKYGSLPCNNNLQSQIEWVKQNIKRLGMTINYYGYGVNPLGNKLYIDIFNPNTNSYSTTWLTNDNASSALTTGTIDVPSNYIDNNGYVNFIIYTDSASSTTTNVAVLPNHGLSIGDIIYNNNRSKYAVISFIDGNGLLLDRSITYQQINDVIKKYHYTTNKTTETNTTSYTVKITNHELSVGDYIKNNTRNSTISRVSSVTDANTFSISPSISGQTTGDSISFYPLLGEQTIDDSVAPAAIYTDYISLDVELGLIGYDLLVPSDPRRDSASDGNYDTCILIESNINSITSDFGNKVKGSIIENPNIIKVYKNKTLYDFNTTSTTTELTQTEYDRIKINNDGSILTVVETRSGYIPQLIFTYDIVKAYEKQYGVLNAPDKASVVKSLIKQLDVSWYGYATNPNGYKVYLCYWANGGDTPNSWVGGNLGLANYTNNTKSLSVINTSDNPIDMDNVPIDNNGMLNILVYTNAATGSSTTTKSQIITDYCSLNISFRDRQDNAVLYLTGNSLGIETTEANKVGNFLIETDLSDLCNSNFKGNNDIFLNTLKNIGLNIWANASGVNDNKLANGVNCYLYDFYSNAWINNKADEELYQSLSNMNITKLLLNPSKKIDRLINPNNKIYALITPQYPSLSNFPSKCNLDFIQVEVDYNSLPYKIPDIQNIGLTSNWSVFIKGFCPNWDSNTTKNNRCIFSITNDSMIIKLYFDSINKKWILARYNPTESKWDYLMSNTTTFIQYQMHNFLIEQTSTGVIKMKILKNGGSAEKYIFNDDYIPNGLGYFYSMTDENLSNRADGYIDRLFYMEDINYEDAAAELLLRGNLDKFEYGELYDPSKSYIPVMPNNRYLVNGITNTGTMNIVYLNNETIIKTDSNVLSSAINNKTIQIPSNCNKISFSIVGSFKDVSFKLIM